MARASNRRSRSVERSRGERGQALVEFSLVFFLFVFILYGLIAFGMMLAVKQSITQAAADGARAAIGVPAGDHDLPLNGVDDRLDHAINRATKAVTWLGASHQPDITANFVNCTTTSSNDCVHVSVIYQYKAKPLVPPAPGLGLVTPEKFTSESTIQVS